MSYFVIYLITMLGSVNYFLKFLTVISFIGIIICAIAYGETESAKWGSRVKKFFFAAVVCGFFTAIVPDTKQAAIIAGGGLTVEMLTSPEAKEIGGKSLVLLNQYLDEKLKDGKNK